MVWPVSSDKWKAPWEADADNRGSNFSRKQKAFSENNLHHVSNIPKRYVLVNSSHKIKIFLDFSWPSLLRWPEPIYIRDGYIFLIAFFIKEDFADFHYFWHPY